MRPSRAGAPGHLARACPGTRIPQALARLQCFACGKAAGWLEDIARTQDGRRVKTCEDCTDCLEPTA